MLIVFFFVGLIVFADDAAGPHAFLVNTMDSWQTSDHMPLPPHTAFVATSSVVAGCPDETEQKKGCSWLIDHDEITIEGAGLEYVDLDLLSLKSLADDAPRGGGQANPPGPSAVLVNIPDVVNETMGIKGHCFDPKPDADLVIGRFGLAGAKLHLYDSCGAAVVFNRLVSPAPQNAASFASVADLASFAVRSSGAVTLHLKRFGSMDQGRAIVFQPSDSPGSSGTVVVVIANIDLNATPGGHPSGIPDPDAHFEAYYRLAAREPWIHRRLVPFAQCIPPAEKTRRFPLLAFYPFSIAQRIACPMARINPAAAAP